jgi:myxalamid-type polyketide synthase MxaE and MxaD
VLHLLQALDANGTKPQHGIWVATRGVQSVLVNGPTTSVTQSAVWGLGRVAAREKPELWGGLVDLDFVADPECEAALLMRLVGGDRSENQIVLRGGDRFVARLVTSSTGDPGPPKFRSDHSYLIVGGMGAVGVQVARWLVDQGVRHLTLTGRNGLPPAGDSSAATVVRELEEAGAEVRVIAADSSDRAQMAKVFATFDGDSPSLAGVIHTAAVIEFESIEDIDLDGFLDAVRAKVAGSWILHEETAKLELDFLVFFSSMAAVGGFPQLGHYAAGNCFMDALAHHRQELGLPGLSVNWGLWSDAKSTSDENRQLFERIGLRPMSSERALRILQRVLAGNSAQKASAWIDWDAFRSIYESRGARHFLSRLAARTGSSSSKPTASTQATTSALRSRLHTAEPADALRNLQDTITEVAATILGVPLTDIADRADGFFQMGMDSIMTVELRRRLETLLQINLMTTLAFEYPTVERLANYLAGEVLGLDLQRPGDLMVESKAEQVHGAGDDLESYSDAELAAELDRELAELASTDRRRTR